MNFIKACYSLFLISVCYPICVILTDYKTKKECQSQIIKKITNHFKYKLYCVSDNKINHDNNIIYFADHRTWSDFFIDQITTEYCSIFVSKWIIAFCLPIYTYISGHYLYDMVFFFKRGGTSIPDFEKLIKKNQNNNSGNNILVYPEGTRRSGLNYASNLKKGLIYYAYKENCPIQFIISKNKENVLNEKKYSVEKDVSIFVHYSDVYYPDIQKYKSMSEYYEYINNEWKTTFNLVYNTDYESKKHEYDQLDITKIHDNNYNIDTTKRWLVRIGIISFFTVVPGLLIKLIYC